MRVRRKRRLGVVGVLGGLALLAGSTLLGACGSTPPPTRESGAFAQVPSTLTAPLVTTIPSTSTLLPTAANTPTEEPFTLPSPEDQVATAVAFQTALVRHGAEILTSVALSPRPTYVGGPGPMLETPGPTATWGTTWFECGSPDSGFDPQFYSCWQGTVAGVRLYLLAGREGHSGDIRQGLLEVDEVDNRSPYPDFMKLYQTPQKVGAVRIAAVSGTRVMLLPWNAQPTPVSFVFDLATRQWVPLTPLPSPSPGPSPLPSPVPSGTP